MYTTDKFYRLDEAERMDLLKEGEDGRPNVLVPQGEEAEGLFVIPSTYSIAGVLDIRSRIKENYLFDPQKPLRHIRLKMADLEYAHFDGLDLGEAVFEHCKMNRTSFKNCDLEMTSFNGCDLSGAEFKYAFMPYAGFDGACCLRAASFEGSTIPWAQHEVISSILYTAAERDYSLLGGDRLLYLERMKIVGAVRQLRGWCWPDFLLVVKDEAIGNWALETLAPFARKSTPSKMDRAVAALLALRQRHPDWGYRKLLLVMTNLIDSTHLLPEEWLLAEYRENRHGDSVFGLLDRAYELGADGTDKLAVTQASKGDPDIQL